MVPPLGNSGFLQNHLNPGLRLERPPSLTGLDDGGNSNLRVLSIFIKVFKPIGYLEI